MLPFITLLQHSLLYGAILSAALSALIVASLYWRPMIWIGDATPEAQAAAPPLSAADRRIKGVVGALFFMVLFGVVIASLLALRELAGGALTFADAAVSIFIILMTFNLVDLLLLDWLLVETWRPAFITFPGMETLEGVNVFGGYAHHFRGFLIGTGLSLTAAVVIAVVVVVIT
jgi:hypothetical protein